MTKPSNKITEIYMIFISSSIILIYMYEYLKYNFFYTLNEHKSEYIS